jgi:hypothetical protein
MFGAEFADWLTHQSWIDDLPYLADVARVERLHIQSLFAPDERALSAEEFEQFSDISKAQLRLHPAAFFMWLATPAMSIWLAHQRHVSSEIAPEWKAEGAFFARPTPFVVHAPRIGRAAHRMLAGIRVGEIAGSAIAAAKNLYPNEDCAAVFASLVSLGAFAAPSPERN